MGNVLSPQTHFSLPRGSRVHSGVDRRQASAGRSCCSRATGHHHIAQSKMSAIFRPVFRPFANTYRFLQRSAHESPVVFFSLLIGAVGPIAVVTIPPIRKHYGWKPAERIPTSYPLPQRKREEVTGYDDE